MARGSNPDALTRVSIGGGARHAVMTDMEFDEAIEHLRKAATQRVTVGRGRDRRTRSTLRLDLMSYEAGTMKRSAEQSGVTHYWEPLTHDLLTRVIAQLGELDQAAYQAGYDFRDSVYRQPHNSGIGNPYKPGRRDRS